MPLVCFQCALKALLEGRPAPVFEESSDAHLARCHPDPIATQREREELDRRLAAKLQAEGKD